MRAADRLNDPPPLAAAPCTGGAVTESLIANTERHSASPVHSPTARRAIFWSMYLGGRRWVK